MQLNMEKKRMENLNTIMKIVVQVYILSTGMCFIIPFAVFGSIWF